MFFWDTVYADYAQWNSHKHRPVISRQINHVWLQRLRMCEMEQLLKSIKNDNACRGLQLSDSVHLYASAGYGTAESSETTCTNNKNKTSQNVDLLHYHVLSSKASQQCLIPQMANTWHPSCIMQLEILDRKCHTNIRQH